MTARFNVAGGRRPVILFVVNEAFFFLSHRIRLASAAIESGCEVHLAAPADHGWAPEGFRISEIEALGIRCHEIHLSRRGQNPFIELRSFVSIWRLMRRLNPDLVHLLTIKPLLYGGMAARIAGVRAAVFGVTGLGHVFSSEGIASRLRRALVVPMMRFCMRHPRSNVIVQSRGDRDFIASRGIAAADRIHIVVGSGVDLSEFRFVPLAANRTERVVTLAARLIWDKGVGAFVDAAREIKTRFPEVRFRLVGDTKSENPRSVPAETLNAWVKSGVVEWPGRRDDMPQVFCDSDIVCLPTLYGEGVPKVLLEAAACGRAIIASDTPGCREVVHDGANGLLVDPTDSCSLVNALDALLRDRELCERMGRAGAEMATKSFDVNQVVARTIAVYESLLVKSFE